MSAEHEPITLPTTEGVYFVEYRRKPDEIIEGAHWVLLVWGSRASWFEVGRPMEWTADAFAAFLASRFDVRVTPSHGAKGESTQTTDFRWKRRAAALLNSFDDAHLTTDDKIAVAQVAATMALVQEQIRHTEQQRIANLLAFASALDDGDYDLRSRARAQAKRALELS